VSSSLHTIAAQECSTSILPPDLETHSFRCCHCFRCSVL